MDPTDTPRETTYATGTRLFVRALAVSHAVAFASFWVQERGLTGPAGILPAGPFLSAVRDQVGREAWFDVPSLCWLFGTGRFVDVLCALGIAMAVLLFLGFAQAPCLVLLWAFYLSLVSAGQDFYNFQWDSLLLESTLVAVFLVPWTLARARRAFDPPVLARYLAWWLLFRLMLLSGVVKLTSGDPAWRHLTALTFHYETQPLPSPLAWYAHQLPAWFQELSCAVMFAIEILAPLCLPGPRAVRHAAALALLALQALIAATGNYAFFNLLSAALCVTCLDDAWWRRLGLRSAEAPGAASSAARARPSVLRWFAALYAGVTFFEAVASLSPGAAASPLVRMVEQVFGPSRSFNDYGLFRVMTVERPELVFEGSEDGLDWRAYTLPFKPGDLARGPRWVAPYQPRLDWQLWFAALESPERNPWVETLCERLLRGAPEVLGLFSVNPFPLRPPRYVRVVRYRYEFTDARERAATGNWWRRTPLDFYVMPVSLPSAP